MGECWSFILITKLWRVINMLKIYFMQIALNLKHIDSFRLPYQIPKYMEQVKRFECPKTIATAGHLICACAKIWLISSSSIFTRSDKNTNFGAIFSHFTFKYLRLTIHKQTEKGSRKFLKTNCTFKIGCRIKYIFAAKNGIFGYWHKLQHFACGHRVS